LSTEKEQAAEQNKSSEMPSFEDVMRGLCFHVDPLETETTLEQVTRENKEATETNAKQITKLTNDAIASVKELEEIAQSTTIGAELAEKAIRLINDLASGCHRANRENAELSTAANQQLVEIDEVKALIDQKQRRLNLAALMLGVRQLQEVEDDPALMEELSLG